MTLKEIFGIDRKLPLDSFEEYIDYVSKHDTFEKEFKYEPITIVEREVEKNEN